MVVFYCCIVQTFYFFEMQRNRVSPHPFAWDSSWVGGQGKRDKDALVVIMKATVVESGIPFVSTKCTYLLNHAISHPTSAYRRTERQTDRRTFSFDSYLSFQFQFQLLVMQWKFYIFRFYFIILTITKFAKNYNKKVQLKMLYYHFTML